MKTATLIIDGKEIEIQITQEQLDKLCPQKKKTGYESVGKDYRYWSINGTGAISTATELNCKIDREFYYGANYYSDKTVAENNARADKLMRQLRRFAVEHREKELDWNDKHQIKYDISYDRKTGTFILNASYCIRTIGTVHFDKASIAWDAIDAFKDELLWYFTEYKDSL